MAQSVEFVARLGAAIVALMAGCPGTAQVVVEDRGEDSFVIWDSLAPSVVTIVPFATPTNVIDTVDVVAS